MAITQTTLSKAITSSTGIAQNAPTLGGPAGTIVTPVSMTGIVAPGPNKSNRVVLWIDHEAFEVDGITGDGLSAICNRASSTTLRRDHVAGVPVWVGKESDFSYFINNEVNALPIFANWKSPSFFTTNASAPTDTATLTAAQLLGGQIVGTPTGAANYTTPTAALIIAALASYIDPFINATFEFTIENTSAGANTITLVAGTGVTLSGGTVTVAQNAARRFKVVVTSVALNTVTIYQNS